MEKIFVKPSSEGLIVRDPDNISQVIPPEGKFVFHTPQWKRYIKCGDVIVIDKNPEKPKKDAK